MSYILIIGAKSDIAKAVAREYAKHGYDLYLAARNAHELHKFARDISVRSQRIVKILELDIRDFKSHHFFYEQLEEKPLGTISAVGYLGTQYKAQTNFHELQRIVETNFTGIANLLNIVASDLEQRRHGFIVGITSVAGDRGRKKNYIYGSAKAALGAYLSGLRNSLHGAGVHVMTVKPGFVATKMTAGMDLPERLTAQPEDVAKVLFKAQQKKKNEIYVKSVWRWIMMIVKVIPEWKFKKMDI